MPAHQGLDAGDGARGRGHHGLVVGLELVGVERPSQRGLQVEALDRAAAHGLDVEHPGASCPSRLGLVHGHVGVVQDVVGRALLRRHADADADAGHHLAPAGQGDGGAQRLLDAGGHHLGVPHVDDVLQQHCELVAAEAGQGVARAQGRGDALGDGHEQTVAGLVADAVVDELEAVHVREQHAVGGAAALAATQRLLQAVEENPPVGQAGEVVVEGVVGQALLEGLALGDVPEHRHRPGHVGLVHHR